MKLISLENADLVYVGNKTYLKPGQRKAKEILVVYYTEYEISQYLDDTPVMGAYELRTISSGKLGPFSLERKAEEELEKELSKWKSSRYHTFGRVYPEILD